MLLEISTQLARIVLISLMILGTIRNVLNLFIFTRPRFLRSSCTLYFIAVSINNIIAIYVSIFNRLLIGGFSIDVGLSSTIVCKLRPYIGYVILALLPYFYVLTCFDRYCSSSASVICRPWSNKTMAKRFICGAIVLAAILYSHMSIFFQIQKVGSDTICYPEQGLYDSFLENILYNYLLFFSIYFPPLPTTNDIHRRLKIHLIRILFSHFLTQILCVLPFAIITLLGMFVDRTTIVYTFVLRILTLPLFVSYTIAFYVNTLSSQIYRRQLIKLIKKIPPVYGYRTEKLVSIEKALEPIVPHIDELPYYIKIAKKYCHFPSEHGLTQDQSAAIYIYIMEWGDITLYHVLDKAL
ncbi:unnamed protein product [Rotaria socialis]|uniref:G-protein coupled receptors family 1 profile domain-containing protein n=1 Tax=Rotaria socialis TaxID=392032 RepID=A0A818HD11_9BILA|nr:unnamed protein product [Rotaria socialis]